LLAADAVVAGVSQHASATSSVNIRIFIDVGGYLMALS
jgi:hypothetical protein